MRSLLAVVKQTAIEDHDNYCGGPGYLDSAFAVRFRVYNSRYKIKTIIYEDVVDEKGEN